MGKPNRKAEDVEGYRVDADELGIAVDFVSRGGWFGRLTGRRLRLHPVQARALSDDLLRGIVAFEHGDRERV